MKDIIIKILKIAGYLLFAITLLFLCIVTGLIFFSPDVNTGVKGVMLGFIFFMEMIKGE